MHSGNANVTWDDDALQIAVTERVVVDNFVLIAIVSEDYVNFLADSANTIWDYDIFEMAIKEDSDNNTNDHNSIEI